MNAEYVSNLNIVTSDCLIIAIKCKSDKLGESGLTAICSRYLET